MKVKELIEQLQELDPETQIVMSCDNIGGEGNNYSPLCDFVEGFYLPESTWSGEFTSKENVEEFFYFVESDEYQKAICFFPIN